MDPLNNFRTNVQLLRVAKGLSCKELSAKLGMNLRRMSNLEYKGAHMPSARELTIISRFFGVTIDDLVNKRAMVQFEDKFSMQ